MLKRRSATKLVWDGNYDDVPEQSEDLQKGYKGESAGRAHRNHNERYSWEDEDKTIYPEDEQ